MRSLGFRVSEFRALGLGFSVSEFRALGLGFSVSEFRALGLGLWVSEFRVLETLYPFKSLKSLGVLGFRNPAAVKVQFLSL